jgi:hypothetical protein
MFMISPQQCLPHSIVCGDSSIFSELYDVNPKLIKKPELFDLYPPPPAA